MDIQTNETELDSFQMPREEEIRASIVQDFGFDEIADAERIDKLVEKEMAQSKRLSQAIGQKIKHRTDAEDLRKRLDTPKENQFSPRDIIALAKADIDPEDFDEVENYAKYRKISPMQAVQDPMLRSILSQKREERKTAEATQVKGPRQSTKVTGETLMEMASRDQVPEREEDIRKLVDARMARAKDSKVNRG